MMEQRGFFDDLDENQAEQHPAQAMEFEPVGDQSAEADPQAEVAAFVHHPVPVIEARQPAGQGRQSAVTVQVTPLGEAAGFHSTGGR